MRSTAYSRKDVEDARSGLRLLKNRMDNLKMRKGISNSQNANRDRDGMLKPPTGGMSGQHTQSNNFGNAQAAGNRRANNYAAGQRPPMIPPSLNNSNLDAMNTSNISMRGGQNGSTPKNQNYRKVFKPNFPNNNL